MSDQSTARQTTAVAPPADVRRIDTESDARDLAHRVLTPGRRRWPVVVLTISAGQQEPFGIRTRSRTVGDLAEVVLMPTSDVSWAFSREMKCWEALRDYGRIARTLTETAFAIAHLQNIAHTGWAPALAASNAFSCETSSGAARHETPPLLILDGKMRGCR
ncbi:hypothetical protein KBX37_28530 [Micromonospora sp. U56]|uniref:hypothetical protein n=1 Tax=Micromonospora sp. U56 TaxID=2824900 RepID=UPI001B39BC8C|nr:hypothetical protein [Micromonospora sp. U56]MBQ0896989.1 hypothetical protein [Micromonospora sp. U56]